VAHYHHGNLKQALLNAGLHFIKQEKPLTIRGLAKAVDVTPAAVYRHFTNKEALLAQLAEEGFKKMHQAFSDIKAPTAKERLFRIGEAYIHFALNHPEHFHIMFSRFDWHSETFDELTELGNATFESLASTCRELMPDEIQAEWLIAATWSQVHGYAMLSLRKCTDSCEQPELFPNDAAVIRHLIEATWGPHFPNSDR
jgi:Transcriptional regulator